MSLNSEDEFLLDYLTYNPSTSTTEHLNAAIKLTTNDSLPVIVSNWLNNLGNVLFYKHYFEINSARVFTFENGRFILNGFIMLYHLDKLKYKDLFEHLSDMEFEKIKNSFSFRLYDCR